MPELSTAQEADARLLVPSYPYRKPYEAIQAALVTLTFHLNRVRPHGNMYKNTYTGGYIERLNGSCIQGRRVILNRLSTISTISAISPISTKPLWRRGGLTYGLTIFAGTSDLSTL
jgi:hypothetical protein